MNIIYVLMFLCMFFVTIFCAESSTDTLKINQQHLLAQKAVKIGRLSFANTHNSPKVSIILPAYNVVGHGRFEGAVHSILQQTFIDFELLLVDDGSKDDTKSIIKKFEVKDKRVVGVFLKQNGGLPNALNAGLNRSRASLITWTSSDNYLEPMFLEYFYQASIEYPESNFFFSDWNMVDKNDNFMLRSAHDYRAPYTLFLQWQGCAAFMWRKRVRKIFDVNLGGVEDHEMWIRITEGQHVNVWIQNALYNYTFNHGSWEELSSSGKLKNKVNEMVLKTYNRHTLQEYDDISTILDPYLLFPSIRFNYNFKRTLATSYYRLGTVISTDFPGPDGGVRVALRQLLPHCYGNSIKLWPEMYESRFNKILAHLANGEWGIALQEFHVMKKMIDGNSKTMLPRKLLAKIEILQRKFDKRASNQIDDQPTTILYEDDNMIFEETSYRRERTLLMAYGMRFLQNMNGLSYNIKAFNMKRPYRLAVIPSDPLEAYEAGGYANWLEDYYNPLHFFDEVFLLSPLEVKERIEYGMYIIPTQPNELSSRIKELNIHLVRAYGGYWPCDMATFGKVPGVPVIVSVHDTNMDVLHDSIADADFVLPVSRAVADLVKFKLLQKNVDENIIVSKIHMFSNRVDEKVFHPNIINHHDYDNKVMSLRQQYPGKYRILFIGRRKEQKNWDTLIKSLAILGNDYVLIMIGRGEKEPIIQLATELNVLSQIYLIDSIENSDIPYYQSIADVFATVSRWEGFGIVFIEALATGRSVVVTSDIAPMNEYITHGFNGLLVKEYENPKEVAKFLISAIHNKTVRSHILANAPYSVDEFLKSNVDRWEVQLYRIFLQSFNKA